MFNAVRPDRVAMRELSCFCDFCRKETWESLDEALAAKKCENLATVGAWQLVATDSDAFVEIAANLARDLDGLEDIRHDLRGRMLRSPIMDEDRYIAFLDAELRRIWEDWCERQVRQPADPPR